MTAGTEERTAGRAWQLSAEALALWQRFPPRTVPASWPATRQSRGKVVARLLAPPFLAGTSQDRCNRKLALLKVLDWLELQPGRTWQERWDASSAGDDGRVDWRRTLLDELAAAGNLGPRGEQAFKILGLGMAQLIGADVVRPGLGWLMSTSSPIRIANEMSRVRANRDILLVDSTTAGVSKMLVGVRRLAGRDAFRGRSRGRRRSC